MSLKEYINHKNKKIKENAESDSEEEEETSLDDIKKKINQLEEICVKNKNIQ